MKTRILNTVLIAIMLLITTVIVNAQLINVTYTPSLDAKIVSNQATGDPASENFTCGINKIVLIDLRDGTPRTTIITEIRSLLKFDLSSIPANAIIQSATLTLYSIGHGNTTPGSYLQPIVQNWDGFVSWENQPSAVETGQVYLAPTTNPDENYTLDISFFVNAWVKGVNNYGMLFRIGEGYINNCSYNFASSDYPEAEMHPTLEITYILPIELNYTITTGSSQGRYDITANITGGVPPYQIEWNTGATTQNLTNVTDGIYILYVTDALGNEKIFNVSTMEHFPVVWTDLVNTEVDGITLKPVYSQPEELYGAASLNKIDANADGGLRYSTEQLPATDFIRNITFGLSETNTDASNSTIEYSFKLNFYVPRVLWSFNLPEVPKAYIYENGATVEGVSVPINIGDVYEITRTARSGNIINYIVNGVVVHQTITDPSKSLIADVSISSPYHWISGMEMTSTPKTKLIAEDCGITNVAFDKVLHAEPIAEVTQYEFLVENSIIGFSQSIINDSNSFSLVQFNGDISPNTTYDVKVRGIFNNAPLTYGDACQIATSLEHPLTQLNETDCGAMAIDPDTILNAEVVLGASQYDFKLENIYTGNVINYTSPTHELNLGSAGVINETTYKVSVRTVIGSHTSDYGKECYINVDSRNKIPSLTANLLKQQFNEDPYLQTSFDYKMQELQTYVDSIDNLENRLPNVNYTIPIVFHIQNEAASGSLDELVATQIDILNTAFDGTNISFCSAVNRPRIIPQDDVTDWSVYNSSTNGITYCSLSQSLTFSNFKYLNVRVVQDIAGAISYTTSLPQVNCDGLIILDVDYLATKILVREVGHWLGLLNTFGTGSSSCPNDINDCKNLFDHIEDTPPVTFPNFYCQPYKSCPECPCSISGCDDMVENYMDYTPESCITTFTTGQINTMKAVLDNYPLRNVFTSDNLFATGCLQGINAAFSADRTQICTGNTVILYPRNNSVGNFTYTFTFQKGNDISSEITMTGNPNLTINSLTLGVWDVALTVVNTTTTETVTQFKPQYIYVDDCPDIPTTTWHFGYRGVLEFATGQVATPQPPTTTIVGGNTVGNSYGGSAYSGDLYSDGEKVATGTQQICTYGNTGVNQPVLFVENTLFINNDGHLRFTTSPQLGQACTYTDVASVNPGYLTAIPNACETGYWIITISGTEFKAFPFIAGSIDAGAVVTTSTKLTGTIDGGNIAVSPNNKRVAFTSGGTFIYDFDNSTANFKLIGTAQGEFGVCFSPNSNLLYTTKANQIFQTYIRNLRACDNSLSPSCSPTVVKDSWPLQLGPDNKIYTGGSSAGFMSVINYPDARNYAGTFPNAYGFNLNCITLYKEQSIKNGLPNKSPEPAEKEDLDISFIQCKCYTVKFRASGCYGNNPNFTWEFGDGHDSSLENPEYNYSPLLSAATVTLTIVDDYVTQTVQRTIDFTTPPAIITPTTNICWNNTTVNETYTADTETEVAYSWTVNGSGEAFTDSYISHIFPVNWYGTSGGDVSVEVTDLLTGCIATTTESILVSLPPDITITRDDSKICSDGYVQLAIQTTGQTFSWYPTDGISDLSSLVPTITNPTATLPYPITYSLVARDNLNCQSQATVTIANPLNVSPVLSATTQDALCNACSNGSVDLTITNGTSPFTFNWSNAATSEDLTDIQAGNYSVTVSDANGCTATTDVTITEPLPGVLNLVVSETNSCDDYCNGSVTVNAYNGTSPYTYTWNDAQNQTTQTISDLCPGTYTVTVVDATGNSATITTSITSTTVSSTANEVPFYTINSSNTPVTWNNVTYNVLNNIEVEAGCKLTLQKCTLLISSNVHIIVKAGGKLIIDDHSLLTNSDICGYIWRGIVIYGDPDQAQPANPNTTDNPQGFVWVKNYSVIKNATNAFIVGWFESAQTWKEKGGGMLWITSHSEVVNFRNGVYFRPYVKRNNSKFIDCSFKTIVHINSNFYEGISYSTNVYYVYCPIIEGLTFNNVSFIDVNNSLTSVKKAIYNLPIAGNVVNPPNLPNNIINCRFINLDYGVYNTLNKSIISNNIFTNVKKSILVAGGKDNLVIANNIFEEIPVSDPPDEGIWNDSWGIYLNYGKNNVIKNNKFSGSASGNTDVGDTYGIVALAAGGNPPINTYYNNYFKGIDIGLQTEGTGHIVRCNNFNSNADGSATTGNLHPITAWAVFGKPLQQGSDECDEIGGDKYAAGNEWKDQCNSSGSEIDIKINTSTSNFMYYAHKFDILDQLSVKPLCSNTYWVDNYLYPCNEKKKSTSCESENPDNYGSPGDVIFSTQLTELTNQINTATDLLTEGNSPALTNMVINNAAAGQLKNELLNVSPYLSDRVLISALTEKPTPLPAGHVKEVVVANSPITELVMNVVDNLGLPPGIKQQIDAAQVGVSARERLESQLEYNQAQVMKMNTFAISYYLENGDSAQALSMLNTSTNYEDKKWLAEIYLSANDLTSCASALVEVLNTADSENTEDVNAYIELMNFYINLAEQSKTIFDMTTAQEQTIRNIASGNTETAYKAKIILEVVYGEEFEYPILKFGNEARSLQIQNNALSVNQVYINKGFNLYPNPAKDKIVFEYNASEYVGNIIEIYDNLGRKVIVVTIKDNENSIVIKTRDWENGIYHYLVRSSSDIIYQNQFVIIK